MPVVIYYLGNVRTSENMLESLTITTTVTATIPPVTTEHFVLVNNLFGGPGLEIV
jgi:hypothetical protein